ncbi:MAG: hypothetical protein AAB618_00565 [Patescibacteria group bacterium]
MKLLRSHYFLTFLFGAVLLVLPNLALAAACDGVGGTINCAAQEVVYSIVMGILGLFVALAASLLSFAVNSFVLGFGDAFVNTGIGVAVDNTWIIVRDFVNLGFIFGFVYIGFKMILNSSDSNTRRWLVNIILAALLVNFSLFVVKFAIDMSNQLAAQIAINGLGSTCEGCTTKDGLQQIDLATEFMARLGINNSFGLTVGQVDGKGWGYIFGTAMLMLTAMFVFAAGGIMLIMRFAVLNLFMVLSPIMFLSWIIPAIKDTFERFWSMFIGRALVAPIYLLFIYFSLQIISGLQVSVGEKGNGFANPDWAGTFQGAQTVVGGKAAGQLGTFPFFILVCIFLGLSVWAADKLGADGGKKAMSLGKSFERKVRGAVGGGTLGVGARIGRNTAGALANRYTESEFGKTRAVNSRFGKLAYKAAGKAADSTWDVRNVGGVGKGLGLGESSKGGFVTRQKAAVKDEEKFMDSLGTKNEDEAKAEVMGTKEYTDLKDAQNIAATNLDAHNTRLSTARRPYRDEIKKLNTKLVGETDAAKRQILAKKIVEQQLAMKAIEDSLKEETDRLAAAHAAAKKEAEDLLEKNATKAQYKHQLSYLDRREKETKNKWLRGSEAGGGGASTGIIGTAAIGGTTGAVGGVLVAGALGGEWYKDKNVVKELRKKYGFDGSKKKKSKKEQDAMKEQAALLKELDDKKDDDKKKEE